MSKVKALPKRSDVDPADCWNLASLYPSDKAWNAEFDKWSKQIEGYTKFRGKLGRSAKTLADCLNFDRDIDRLGERLGTFAFLKTTEDQANSDYQRMKGRFQHVATKAGEAGQLHSPGDHGDPPEGDREVSEGARNWPSGSWRWSRSCDIGRTRSVKRKSS